MRVTADPLSNSLLVLGSDRDYLALQKILRELDAPRPQVFIEALIIEVGSGWSRAIGTTWHAGHLTRDGLWLGALGHPQLSSFVNLGAAGEAGAGVNGFLGGIVGLPLPGVAELLGTSIPSFTVLFQALAQRDEVEILSAPHVTTTDHMEALLSSGQIIPFVSGATGLAGTTSGSAPLVERQPVGLTLKVTPHVGASGKVRLDIDLVLEDVLPGGGEFGPSTSNRRIKNSVVVGDQESAVLGGLMTQKVQRLETKIPLLGDIPILGLLFRRTERKQEKANLVVLVTPFVMLDSLDRRPFGRARPGAAHGVPRRPRPPRSHGLPPGPQAHPHARPHRRGRPPDRAHRRAARPAAPARAPRPRPGRPDRTGRCGQRRVPVTHHPGPGTRGRDRPREI